MTWTDPSDYSTGQLISAAIWNALIGATGNLASHTAGGVVTTAGDTIYATGDNAVSRLAKGTARQTLAMNSGASAPEWAASSRSVLTTAGDVMYASGTNTPARLAKGTGRQNLTMNSGATAPEWTASPASTLTAKADVLSASAANTPARLAVGANDTVLTAASGESTGLKWAAVSGGLTTASQWRLTTDFTGDAAPIASNLEEVDAPAGFGILGSSMTESSGIFTFPSTGYWYVRFDALYNYSGASTYTDSQIYVTTDNSSYNIATYGRNSTTTAHVYGYSASDFIVAVTNVSNVKVRFHVKTEDDSATCKGNTGYNYTYMTFIRLGGT